MRIEFEVYADTLDEAERIAEQRVEAFVGSRPWYWQPEECRGFPRVTLKSGEALSWTLTAVFEVTL